MTDEEKKAVSFAEWKRKNLHRHGQKGYFALKDLPQRPSIANHAFGTGWPAFDRLFKFYFGQFVVVTGIAGEGKSTFLLNVLCNVARQGHNFFLYAPENERYLRDKLRLIWNDDETFDQFCTEQCFLQSAEESSEEEPQTLFWILEQATVAIMRDNVRIVLIDPWNELERAIPKGMMMTDYIAECLMMIKRFCRAHDAIVIMVAHPTKAVNEGGGRQPRLADIEGSMNWFNKCDNGLVVIRDKQLPVAKVISAKVREIGAGRTGDCNFYVDPTTGIFTPQDTANYGEHRG